MRKFELIIVVIAASFLLVACDTCDPYKNVMSTVGGERWSNVRITKDGVPGEWSNAYMDMHSRYYDEMVDVSLYTNDNVIFRLNGVRVSGRSGNGRLWYDGPADIVFDEKDYNLDEVKLEGSVRSRVATKCDPVPPGDAFVVEVLIEFTIPEYVDNNITYPEASYKIEANDNRN